MKKTAVFSSRNRLFAKFDLNPCPPLNRVLLGNLVFEFNFHMKKICQTLTAGFMIPKSWTSVLSRHADRSHYCVNAAHVVSQVRGR